MIYKRITLILTGIVITLMFGYLLNYTSRDEFCNICHAHPQATNTWRFSTHFDNPRGIKVHCVECHLPPEGISHLTSKVETGLRDVVAFMFTDISKINWDQRSTRSAAAGHVYKSACLYCHQNLFPRGLSHKGEEAHLYYDQRPDDLRCINCHLEVGHYHDKKTVPDSMFVEKKGRQIYTQSASVDSFINFKETIPGTSVAFDMIAIPGGDFMMGSPPEEPFRQDDEGPQHRISVKSFWMGKFEVSWDEYQAFYHERHRRKLPSAVTSGLESLDARTGPTPPYGNPDQGWGRGNMPAITMTHHAARVYCQWLSEKTGKLYRLPTEIEWEYACRAGTQTPYFFPGDPEDFTRTTFFNELLGPDTAGINAFVKYAENSNGRTHPPESVMPNAFGLYHMLGNVKEFCLDGYLPDRYSFRLSTTQSAADNMLPEKVELFVVRGGSYTSDAADLRVGRREYTRPKAWQLTDPQQPKSRWWYSDCTDVGFRVVCVYQPQAEDH